MKGQPQHARRPSTKTVQQSKWKNGVGIPPSSRPESENVIGFDALIANRFTHSAWSPEFSLIHNDVLEVSQKSAKCPSNG